MKVYNKLFFAIIVAAILVATSIMPVFSASLNSIHQQITVTKKDLAESKSQEKALTSQIATLDAQIVETQTNINRLETEIDQTKSDIQKKEEELDQKNQEINIQTDALNSRLRAMYKNGEIGYLEVILGSGSFLELMNNVDMVSRVYEQDEEFLGLLQEQYDAIAETKRQLEELRESLAIKHTDLKMYEDNLATDKQKAEELREQVQTDIGEMEKLIDELNATAEQISAQIRASQSVNTQFIGGKFIVPATSYVRVSSYYGYRTHPITGTYKMHTGVDFAAPKGTNCVASASGTVIYSGWNSGGYGYTVIIDHGGGVTTLYAHNDSLVAKVGDYVTQGQLIAKIGSTGNSTGPHCHLEVRINGKHTDPMPYLTGGA